jgi:hypothetical protein
LLWFDGKTEILLRQRCQSLEGGICEIKLIAGIHRKPAQTYLFSVDGLSVVKQALIARTCSGLNRKGCPTGILFLWDKPVSFFYPNP